MEGLSPDVVNALCGHHWPGNVREMEHVIERAVVLCKNSAISREHLPEAIITIKKDVTVVKIPIGLSLKDAEKEIIQKTLQMTRGSKKDAAKILGISTRKIEYRAKEWE